MAMVGPRASFPMWCSPFVRERFCPARLRPDQIVDNRKPYFNALDAADLAFRGGNVDVSKMEELLGSLLANQLAQFYKSVGGKLPG
jgi:hypothetical protein